MPVACPDLVRLMPNVDIKRGVAYLTTRMANGALGLVHAIATVAALGSRDAGRFFLLWTAAWMLAVVAKAGIDGILPRLVAESASRGRPIESIRRVGVLGAGLALALCPGIYVLLGVPVTAAPVLIGLATAFMWAATLIISGLLRARSRADLAGLTGNLIWAAGATSAPLIALPVGGTWLSLSIITACTSALSLIAVTLVAHRTVGLADLAGLAATTPRPRRAGLDRDAAGGAAISGLSELMIWLPVVLAAAGGLGPAEIAAVFIATRIAGLASWVYQAIVAVQAPQIASAIAARDLGRVRLLIRTGSGLGATTTVPICVAGVALSPQLIEWTTATPVGGAATALALLISARAVDAATGPVSEALLVGRRTWLDALLTAVAIALGSTAALLLVDEHGVVAIGAGAAGAFTAANAFRLLAVRRLLRSGWALHRSSAPTLPGVARIASIALVVMGGAGALGAWYGAVGGVGRAVLAILASLLVAAGTVMLARTRHGLRAVLASPVGLIALLLVTHFAVRPAALLLDPQSAVLGLGNLGFSSEDLAIATALGAVGLGAMGVGFVLSNGSPKPGRRRPANLPASPRLVLGLVATLILGVALWLALFFRIGGVDALVTDPAVLHLRQLGGAYGVFGMLLCFATALLALAFWLERRDRALLWVFGAAAAVSIGASLALATRGPLMVSALAALAMVARRRRPTTRQVVAALAVGAVAILGVSAVRQVRHVAQQQPLDAAAKSLLHESPLSLVSGDLIEFDHLVALQRLVPDPLPWLNGTSVDDVPGAFVPRALWAEKPLPVDYRLSRQIYGPETRAGTPPTLVGEMYWNFGLYGGTLILLGFGIAAGRLWWRWSRIPRPTALSETSVCVSLGYGYLLLTRPLAAMALTTAEALLAVLVAAVLAGVLDPRRMALPAFRAGQMSSLRLSALLPTPARALDLANRVRAKATGEALQGTKASR